MEAPHVGARRVDADALRVGVLALQGDFAAHAHALRAAGVEQVTEVRRPAQLDGLAGLVMPGGESTTLLRLLALERMDDAIRAFHARGGHLFGTCAGLILLAKEVEEPAQDSLGLLDVTVQRNGFGRQRESFVDQAALEWPGRGAEPTEVVFIRAPRILWTGDGVEVLARWKDEPILVRQGRLLGATFHPELSPGVPIHRLWVDGLVPVA
ncbi:MAG: pyridoxal 5'-phosphate synthase glutaminase subunit PdxT [Candidatus Eisenbacteria bacterium]